MNGWSLTQNRRKAVFEDGALQCFRITGQKGQGVMPIWPPLTVESAEARKLAREWLSKGKPPVIFPKKTKIKKATTEQCTLPI